MGMEGRIITRLYQDGSGGMTGVANQPHNPSFICIYISHQAYAAQKEEKAASAREKKVGGRVGRCLCGGN